MKSLRGHEIDGTGPFEGMKHTPTPWRVAAYEDVHGNIQPEIVSNVNNRVVIDRVLELMDAEFVVKAVNSHEALLGWAKSYRDMIKTLMSLNSEEIISLKLSGLIFDHHLESLEKDIANAEK